MPVSQSTLLLLIAIAVYGSVEAFTPAFNPSSHSVSLHRPEVKKTWLTKNTKGFALRKDQIVIQRVKAAGEKLMVLRSD